MPKVMIDRELLERLETWVTDDCEALRELQAILAAPLQPAGDAHKHEAQPEVAQNTGSRSMTNKLSSQGCTGCTGVEGAATPCETPDAVDIFAWATFDGEGSYDLRLYEDNEGYLDDFRDANPLLHPDWVFPLCRLSDAQRAIAELDRKVWEWSSAATAEAHRVDELKAERDTLRQQLAERDADAERWRYTQHPDYICCGPYDTDGDYCGYSVGVLKHANGKQLSLNHCIEGRGDSLGEAIDAALAEVNNI